MTKPSVSRTQFLNLFDIIVDYQSAVARLDRKSSWLYPLAVISMGTLMISMANLPLFIRVIENSLPLGLPDDEIKRAMASVLKYQRIGLYLSPLVILLKWLASAALLFITCVVLDIDTCFRRLFALVSQCGLITFLQELTVFLILRIKEASVRTPDDLTPPLGLDLLFTDLGKPAMLVLNYFSVFNIGYILVLTISLATVGNCSKSRAFAATIPNWILPLIFGLVMLVVRGD